MAADTAGTARWLVVTVHGPSEALDAAAEGLFACGAGAVEHVGGGLRTYFAEPADPAAFVASLGAAVEAAAGTPLAVASEWRAEEDWAAVWRRGLAPRRVGERVIVTPSWCTVEAEAGQVVVVIDPQMAFGTGEHASTRGVIRLMQQRLRPGDVVLDVGAGSAVLAITAVLLGAAHADAVEGDGDALPNAAENVERNDVADRVVLEQEWVDAAYLEGRPRRYDMIVANVLSGVLLPLLPAFRHALRPGGALILAGILQSEADAMMTAARAARFRIVAEDREEEWWSVLLDTDAPDEAVS